MSTPKPLNFRQPVDLQRIPERFHAHHEFCFHLHDVMATLLQAARVHETATVTVQFDDQAEADAFSAADDPITHLYQTGRREAAQRITLNQVSLAIYSDLLHFLFESLRALEKRKFTVAFALLRKPLKENLLFASWVCAAEDEFFDRLLRSPADHMEAKDLPPQRRLELIKATVARFPIKFVNPEALHILLFDKNNPRGLAALFDKATHLVTSRSKLLRTEELNLNFIFKNPGDNDIYETVYRDLAMALMYLAFVQIDLYTRMQKVERSYTQWLVVTAMGAYQALFLPGRSSMLSMLNRHFGSFIACPHCLKPIKTRKTQAARLFLSERLDCDNCGHDHHFPLFWLMSKTEWSFLGDG